MLNMDILQTAGAIVMLAALMLGCARLKRFLKYHIAK